MFPCVGVPQLHIPPLCTYSDLCDNKSGIGIAEVKQFHHLYDDLIKSIGNNG